MKAESDDEFDNLITEVLRSAVKATEKEKEGDLEIKQEDEDSGDEEIVPKVEDDSTDDEIYPKVEDDSTDEDEKPIFDSDVDEPENDGKKKPKLVGASRVPKQGSTGATNGQPKKLGGQLRKRKERQRLKTDKAISEASTMVEKDLMSLVFGGQAEIVSQLNSDPAPSKTSKKRKAKRAAIWHDSDDDDDEDGANLKRNKHNRDQGQLTYERRRKQFEQIVGQPEWADLERKRRERSDSEDEMMRTVGHVVKGKTSHDLPKGVIEVKKLKNLNRETKNEGHISCINFHPTSMVALIAGKSGMVSIVAVDGVRNEKLHTIGLQKFRTACMRLSPDGSEAIFGSYRKFFHAYNLLSGESATLKIPVNETWSMRNFRISSCGKYIATAGHAGEVHVLSAKGKELLWTIQLRYVCSALAFTPDSRYLLCHSNDTEVSVYSIDQRRIVNVFIDEGCVNGAALAICPNGQFVATGSRQGIVNIYSLDATVEKKYPVPLKTIDNLTTYIDSLTFNATSELLAIASSNIANAVKLVHVKSGTVFKNFPIQQTNLGHVTTVEFSPSGGYLALGNKTSAVSLFRVKHYQNY